MPIEASGFRQEPFDKSKIHGDTAYLRAQVANKLEPEETQAKGLMEKHSQAALGVRNDSKTLEQVTTNGQAEIDDLFTKKEGEIRDFLATQLPKTEVEPFLGKLRQEWHENHDLHKNTLGLIAEAEQKAKPSPEDVYREVAKPKSAPPSAALGAGAPGAGAPGLGFDINDIINKFKEMYKEDQLATQLGKAFTGGSSPIPGLDEALHEWNKSSLLSGTADLEKRERLYERIKGLISGNVPEDQAAKGQPKKGVEEAPPKPSLRAGGGEAAAPALKAAGSEAAAPVQGVQGVSAGAPGYTDNYLRDALCNVLIAFNYYGGLIGSFIDNYNSRGLDGKPLSVQLAAIRECGWDGWWTTAIRASMNADQQRLFRILFFNPLDIHAEFEGEPDPIVREFSKYLTDAITWGAGNAVKTDFLTKIVVDDADPKKTRNIFWYLFKVAGNVLHSGGTTKDIAKALFADPNVLKQITSPTTYALNPGITFDDITNFIKTIPGETSIKPIQPTGLDQAISTIYFWANDPNTTVADAALARALLNKAVEFGKATPKQDISALCQWTMVWKDAEGKKTFQDASVNAKTQFLFPGCKGGPLYQQCQDALKWFISIDSIVPVDSRARAIATKLLQDIKTLIPNGTLAQLQALEVKNIRENPDFFKMSPAYQKVFFDMTGTHLEALRYRISNWAKEPWENDFLKTILAQIDILENGQSGDMTSKLLTFFISAVKNGVLFTYFGLTIKRITDLYYVLDPSGKADPRDWFNYMDYELDQAVTFKPKEQDQTFWEDLIAKLRKMGHNQPFSERFLPKFALEYLRVNDNFKKFLQLDPSTQSKFLGITGPQLVDLKILYLQQTLAATDPARNLIKDILDIIIEDYINPLESRVWYLNYFIFKQGEDIFFNKNYAGITEDQFNQICDFIGPGINRPKATDIDKVLFNSFRSQSATDGGFFNLIFTYLKDHAIDCQKWTKEQFQAWAMSAASDLFLSDRTKFWSTFGNFSDADIKAAAAIGLIIPSKTDPFPDILKKMQNQLGPLQPLLDIVRRFAGVFGMSADFNAWTDQDWAKLPGLLNKAITDLAKQKNWKNYGITDQNQANIAVAQLKSAQPALQGRTLIQFKTAYNLFSGAINEIQALQKRQPQGTIQELSDWAKKQDASKLSGADLAIFNTLIIK